MRMLTKLSLSFLAIAVLPMLFIAARFAGDTSFDTNKNQTVISLFDTTISSADSIASGANNVYGAYDLVKGTRTYRFIKIFCRPGIVASGDSAKLYFQFLRDSTVTDTLNTWYDSLQLSNSGNVTRTYSIQDSGFNCIVMKIKNIDASAFPIRKQLRIVCTE